MAQKPTFQSVYESTKQPVGDFLHSAIGSRGEEALSAAGQIPGNFLRNLAAESKIGKAPQSGYAEDVQNYGVLANIPHMGRAVGRAAFDTFGTPAGITPTKPPVTTEKPPVTTEKPPVTTEKPPVTTKVSGDTTKQPPMSIYSTPGDTSSLSIDLPNARGGTDSISSTNLAGMDRVYKGLTKRGGIGGMTPASSGGAGGAGSFWANHGYADASAWKADQQAKAQAAQAAQAQAGRDQQLGALYDAAMTTADPSTMTWGEFGAAKARSKAAQGVLGHAVDLEKARMGDSATNAYRQAMLDEQRLYHQGSLGMRQQEIDTARAEHARRTAMDDITGAKTLLDIEGIQRGMDTERGMAQYLAERDRPPTFWEKWIPFTDTPAEKAERDHGPERAAYEAAHPSLLNKGK